MANYTEVLRRFAKAREIFCQRGNRFLGPSHASIDPSHGGVECELQVLTATLEAYCNEKTTSVYYSVRDPRSPVYETADILVANPTIGAVVIEVKGHPVRELGWSGRGLTVRYGDRHRAVFEQVDGSSRFLLRKLEEQSRKLEIPYPPVSFAVVLPRVSQKDLAACPFADQQIPYDHLLFEETLEPEALRSALARAARRGCEGSRRQLPTSSRSIELLDRTLGLLPPNLRDLRKERRSAGVGEEIDRLKDGNCLYPDQRRIALRPLDGHPTLVRGVAGSGKSILLAKGLVDLLESRHAHAEPGAPRPRILVTCFNRALVPLLCRDVHAFASMARLELDASDLTFSHFEGLLTRMGKEWGLEVPSCKKTPDEERLPFVFDQVEERLDGDEALEHELLFDFVFVDEAQDLHPQALRILHRLSRLHPKTQERGIAFFYDDAQNLYGRPRPVWRDLGIHVTGGRTVAMNRSRRTSRPIATFAFNVLLGTASAESDRVGMRGFADVQSLRDSDQFLETENGVVIEFAQRPGAAPLLHVLENVAEEVNEVVTGVRDLLHCEQVRPEEILIQSDYGWQALEPFRAGLEEAGVACRVPKSRRDRDRLVFEEGRLTLSTVHAAKGYDAPVVFLVNAQGFGTDRESRARFYVGATRAQVKLVVTGHGTPSGLLAEMTEVMRRLPLLEPGIT